MKTLIVQNYWTPYRSDLFEALSLLSDIEVLYLGNIGSDRLWNMEKVHFKYITVPAKKIGPFTFSTFKEVDFSLYDRVVVLEHMENIFSILKIIKKFPGRFYLWSGMFNNMYPDKPGYEVIVNLFKKIYRHFLYNAEKYFAYSSLTKEMFIENGVDPVKIEIIKQASRVGNTLKAETKNRKPLNIGVTAPLKILSLGYLRKEKNNEVLVRICSRFSKEDLILTIVGDGPEQDNLKNIAGNNIIFKDYLEGDAKFSEYRDADLFILPTIRDPWALTVNEAMSWGLPVICSNRAGARDMIEGNGIVIDPFNEDELFDAIKTFVDNRILCLEMGSKSLEIVKNYTIEYAARQIADNLSK